MNEEKEKITPPNEKRRKANERLDKKLRDYIIFIDIAIICIVGIIIFAAITTTKTTKTSNINMTAKQMQYITPSWTSLGENNTNDKYKVVRDTLTDTCYVMFEKKFSLEGAYPTIIQLVAPDGNPKPYDENNKNTLSVVEEWNDYIIIQDDDNGVNYIVSRIDKTKSWNVRKNKDGTVFLTSSRN